MAEEKKLKLAELLNKSSKDTVSSNETVLDLLNQNHVILTQISDNFYNIAGKLGAQVSSMKEVQDAFLQQQPQAEPVGPIQQQPQAEPVSKSKDRKSKDQKSKKESTGFGLMALGAALMFGKDIIEGMINFFKNPFEIISNLLGSLGDGIVEWFEEGGFKNFIVDAFEEGKKELIKTFENLKDIFKILIGDPVANLIDNIKLSLIGVAQDGIKMLPDWLKGDSIKEIEKNLDKTKSDIEAGKETRAQENQAARDNLKKRNAEPVASDKETNKQGAEPAAGGAEPPKQTTEDLKEETPQQAPVGTPSSPAPAPTPSVTASSGAAVTTESGTTLKTGAQETEEAAAKPIPTTTDKTPPPALAAADKKPTAVGAIKMPDETVGAAIKEAAKKVGTDESIMLAMAKQESGFNPAAKAGTSSAKGLFQFLDATWKGMTDKYSKSFPELLKGPMDVLASAISGALYIKENSEYLKKNNIPVTGTTIYASHFLGPGGARRLLQADPNSIAASIPGMEGPAKANQFIFYKPGPDKKPDLSAPRTAGEIMEVLYNKVGKSAEQYAAVANNPSVGGNISAASASVNSAKKQPSQQVVYNINNSVATAVKVGAPQGSSTTVARPVG